MKLKRFVAFGASLVLSLSSLFVFAPIVHAATITWDSGGSTNNFSEGANWSGDVVPGTSDDVVFDNTVDPGDQTYVNDTISSVFRSITFTGNGSNHYTISGNAFTITDGVTNSSEARHIISANMDLDGNQSFDADTAPLLISGVLTGSDNLDKVGDQVVTISGNNSAFAGAIGVLQGSLFVGHLNGLGTAAAGTTVTDGGQVLYYFDTSPGATATITEPFTLAGDGDGFIFSNYSLGAYSPADTSFTFSGAITLLANTFVNPSYEMKLTGALSGNFTIKVAEEKRGSLIVQSSPNGSQTANGTYVAPETTYTLAANSPATPVSVYYKQTTTVTGTYGTTNVASGGTLKGSGTVGSLTVGDGGTLAPGQSPGCLNSGNLTFISGSTYEFEVGGATECTEYDQTNVTGTVNLGNGTLSVARYNDFKPVAGQTYMIVKNDSNDAVTGTFNNLAEGAEITVDGYVLSISYVGGDGNDVVLTVKTVPGTPDTGFALLARNPIATFATTTVLAGLLVVLSKRTRRLHVR